MNLPFHAHYSTLTKGTSDQYDTALTHILPPYAKGSGLAWLHYARPISLSEQAVKRVIEHYEQRINMRVRYSVTGEAQTYRRILELQVRQMARCVQEGRVYQPMTAD